MNMWTVVGTRGHQSGVSKRGRGGFAHALSPNCDHAISLTIWADDRGVVS